MHKTTHFWLTSLLIFTTFSLFSQKTIEIRDLSSKETIPFVKVYPQNGAPFLSDIDGRIRWKEEWPSIRLNYSGYRDTTYTLSDLGEAKVLYMSLRVQEVQEVTAMAGENPAHRIMDLVIANRTKNNPLDNDAFRYKSYTKFVTEIDENTIPVISDTTTDTSLVSFKQFFDASHLFLIETSSVRTFVPPSRDREEVIAYKASGFNDPLFATISQELQSFSFYENQFSILGATYINPIAFGGTRRYLFILEDTTIVNTDTVFHIRFRPRKGKNFDGLSGMLYINTNGYAIEKVIAEPAEVTAVSNRIKIVQEYAYIQNKKWFPTKLSSELVVPTVSVMVGDSSIGIISKSSTYIEEVELNPEKVRKWYFDNASLIIKESAGEVKDSVWQGLRKYELTDKEKGTYHLIDSISEAENLSKYLYLLKVLSTGKIPLKYVNADLNRLLGFNQYEGFRLGLGLETSQRLFKPATLGGYFAYGFRDKSFKYGGNLDIRLYPKKGLKLSLAYRDDVIEKGGRPYIRELAGYKSTSQLRNLYVTYMDRQRLAEAELSAYLTANFRLGVNGGFHRIGFLQDYAYSTSEAVPNTEQFIQKPVNELDLFEVGGGVLWSIREEVTMLGETRVSKGSKYPTIYVKYSHFLPNVFGSQLNFERLYAEINHKIIARGVGEFKYCISYGKTMGEAPLTFAQAGFNSFSRDYKLNLSIGNTFETMNNSGYFMSEQAALFTRFNFNTIKSWSKKFQPQISLHHAVGFGKSYPVVSPHLTSMELKGIDKGYYEAGLLLNNLLNKSIGVGFFYHYGPYSEPQVMKNAVIKITLKTGLF